MSTPADELTAAAISVESLWPSGHRDPMATRARNVLKREGIRTLGELAALSDDELTDFRMVGAAVVAEIRGAQARYEFASGMLQQEAGR
jgi:DNA-directed RNA polymerase alpha subunit